MFFTCEYCGKRLISKGNLDRHFCESKTKHLLLKTKTGRTALYYYQEWRRMLGFTVNDSKSFVASKYFKPFINFVEFANENLIPDKKGYMTLMMDKSVLPSFWSNDLYYEFYLEKFDKLYTPMKQVELSLDYFAKLSGILNCEIHQVIKNIALVELLKLIAARKISPWLLLFMQSFKEYVKYHLDNEEKALLSGVINSTEWEKKIKENIQSSDKIKSLLNTLNL